MQHNYSRLDFGPEPFVINIEEATIHNNAYRRALWTGEYLQTTLMSINVNDDIGLEIHPHTDQFLRIEKGQGMVLMGKNRNQLNYRQNVSDNYAIFVPAGTWHNVINTGSTPLKIYSIYAPVHHPWGTYQPTKAIANEQEQPERPQPQPYPYPMAGPHQPRF